MLWGSCGVCGMDGGRTAATKLEKNSLWTVRLRGKPLPCIRVWLVNTEAM